MIRVILVAVIPWACRIMKGIVLVAFSASACHLCKSLGTFSSPDSFAVFLQVGKVGVCTEIICLECKTDVSEMIRTSNARDFGLSEMLEYFEQVLRISEIEELVEREKKIDLLKWNWMEDAVFFNYFTVERIFVFLLKLEMIGRWISMDKEKGSELFRQIIDKLKDEIQIPAEFR